MTQTLLLEEGGKITLPDSLRIQHQITSETPIRIIETTSGILLVPITGEPMSAELAAELAAWQSHAADALEVFSTSENVTALT